MKKRLFSLCSLLLLVCVACSAFAGCGGKKDSTTPPPKGSALVNHPLIGTYCDYLLSSQNVQFVHYSYLVIEFNVETQALSYRSYYTCQEKFATDPNYVIYRDLGDFLIRKLYLQAGQVTANETDQIYCDENGLREQGDIILLPDDSSTDNSAQIKFRLSSNETLTWTFYTTSKSINYTGNKLNPYYNTDKSLNEVINQLNENRYHTGDPK